jgi:predicted membrane chloride channel (bestrophin family)
MGVEELNSIGFDSDYLCLDPETIVNKKQIVPFATLKNVEDRRRKILKRTELPFWRILGYFEGTCLKAMSVDWLLWVTLAVYIALRVILRNDAWMPGAIDLGGTDITVIGGFLSFFLVLFVNQSNQRFQEMYKTSMRCPSRIYDICQIVAPTPIPKPAARRLIRYLNAAHVAGYVGLSRTYSEQEFFCKLNDDFHMLTAQELTRLQEFNMDHGPDAFQELVSWCMQDIETAFQKNLIDAREKSALKDKTTQFRDAMDSLYDYCDQPIHFFYIHFLCLLSAVYLPLFAADNAFNAGIVGKDSVYWSWDILSGLIVLVQAIFVIGLRLLGQKMSDPYGDDLEDLSVMHYVTTAWTRSNKMLEAHCPDPEVSPEIEDELRQNHKTAFSTEALSSGTGACEKPEPASVAKVV